MDLFALATLPAAADEAGGPPSIRFYEPRGQPLAVRWNGTSWSTQPTPAPSTTRASSLGGVSCGSDTNCIAVGSSGGNGARLLLAQRWTGTNWSLQTTATVTGAADSRLTGVRCTSGSACTAVGSYTNSDGTNLTLAERWNGTTWS